MARTALALGALLIAGGGGVLGFALTRKTSSAELSPEQTLAMVRAIDGFKSMVAIAHDSARDHAKVFSTLPPLVNGLKTGDLATAVDQVTNGETRLVPDKDKREVIEVGIVTSAGLQVVSRQPAGSPPTEVAGKTSSSARFAENTRTLTVFEVAEVVADSKSVGYVAVVQSRDLSPWLDQLAAAGIVGRFQFGDRDVTIGGTLPADAVTAETPLSELGAKLVVATPMREVSAASPGLIGIGAGLAGLGLLFVILGLVIKQKPTSAPPVPASAIDAIAELSQARTQLMTAGDVVGAGTPSSIGAATGFSINPNSTGPAAMIGRWEVVRRLGSGGMADVYLARSKGEAGFEKLVAIKVMHAHLARNERSVALFLDEARLAARIHHPNVVAIQDLGKIGDDYVIVMEYVEGVDLERLLTSSREANRPIPIDVGLGMLCRICDGLNAAHTATGTDGEPLGIVHRDVKSANVLVSKQGGVKVVDFGIAKAVSQSHVTVDGETKGTPSMMAPEQRVGDAVDVRADVYSAAAVGFEILTGHPVNLDLAALAHLGIDAWPHLPLPSKLRPELPPELDDILLGAMTFERDKRPDDCVALEAQLELVMKRHGLGATDKDIARWFDGELRDLVPPFDTSQRIPVGASS